VLRDFAVHGWTDPHRLNVVTLQGLTFFLSYAILAAVLGMLQFGYNTGVINAPEVVSDKFACPCCTMGIML
jgi:SP family facilitated glucose transporter-like MFS transporter 1